MMTRFWWYLDPLINLKKCSQSWTPSEFFSGSAHGRRISLDDAKTSTDERGFPHMQQINYMFWVGQGNVSERRFFDVTKTYFVRDQTAVCTRVVPVNHGFLL